eukprot:TRINITY_DN46914_c0_g1_i1.p1 TRINITY_DN46914_c0_g1~~TRINITY_DN46914_c0_g1_i1.p1  ORF type:complete len:340 (-),score=106.84 TRINITY_DN46914_c0_g1_i1:340-1359(-)
MAPKKAPDHQLEKNLEKEVKKTAKLQEALETKEEELKLLRITDGDRASTICSLEKTLKKERERSAEWESNFKNAEAETLLLREALAEVQAQLPKPKRPRESSSTAIVPRQQNELNVSYTSENGETDLSSEDQAGAALEGLVKLRRANHLCDAVIINNTGNRFMVHRCVLAAGSPKLREFLTSSSSSSTAAAAPVEVNLGAALEEAIDVVIRWLYGEISPATYQPSTAKTNEDVLQLAAELGLPRLAEVCARKLALGVTVSNIVARIKLCEQFGLPVLRKSLFMAIIQDKRALAAISQDPRTLTHPALMRELLAAVASAAASEAVPAAEEPPAKRAKGGA